MSPWPRPGAGSLLSFGILADSACPRLQVWGPAMAIFAVLAAVVGCLGRPTVDRVRCPTMEVTSSHRGPWHQPNISSGRDTIMACLVLVPSSRHAKG